ncbi:MAG TPA: YndJ family protein [Blastocatellia bacterium]|nr:YndJ family protein [Blastocatellia bacterium]
MTSALIGGGFWLATVAWLHPSPLHLRWGTSLLLLSPMVLVPLGLRLVVSADSKGIEGRLWKWASMLQLPAALALLVAFALPIGWRAAALSLPWLVVTVMISLGGLVRASRRGSGPLEELSIDAGLIYLAVGGVWAVLARSGARPLGFDPVIVLLTAIHFHYAGFLLPLVTGMAGRRLKSGIARIAALAVIAGVPLTAVGITTTQLGFSHAVESLAALLTALAGLLTAWLHFRLAIQKNQPGLVRGLWLVAALSLTFSMTLAALYGLRFYLPTAWPDIPWMRALHGTANAFGFGFAGLLAWGMASGQNGEP